MYERPTPEMNGSFAPSFYNKFIPSRDRYNESNSSIVQTATQKYMNLRRIPRFDMFMTGKWEQVIGKFNVFLFFSKEIY